MEIKSRIVKGIREELHFHPQMEVAFVMKGHGKAVIQEAAYELERNDIVLFNSGISHRILADRDAILCVVEYPVEELSRMLHHGICIFRCNSAGDRICSEPCSRSAHSDSAHSYQKLAEIFWKIVYQHVVKPHRTECIKEGLFYELLDCLAEDCLLPEYGEYGISGEMDGSDLRIHQMIQYVARNFRYNVSLSDLAESMYTSKSTLSRLFKKQTGIYFAEYVSQMRLQYAYRQLLETEGNVTRIALDSGFSNLSVFNRAFRERYGMSPTDFRRKAERAMQGGRGREEQRTAQGGGMREGHREEELQQERRQSEELRQERRQTEELPQEMQREEELLREIREAQGLLPGMPKSAISQVEADASGGEPYEKIWNKAINVGSVATLLLANIQYHLTYLKENLGFRYARLWNVFSTKLMMTDGRQTSDFYYDKLDMVLDFLVSSQLIPFLDFGMRPDTAVMTENVVLYFEDEGIRFQTREAWEALVTDVIRHVVERYGVEEVNRWIFELGYDTIHDTHCYEDEDYEYFNAFRHLYGAVKRFAPGAEAGGPLFISDWRLGEAEEWLARCKREGCGPDFLSLMLFPYRTEEGDGEARYFRSTEFLMEQKHVEAAREMMGRVGAECKLYISEWNSSISSRNYLNDSCFRAAYMARTMTQLLGQADMVCIWMASDWVSNYKDARGIANGGNGLLTKDTICKPAYHAVAFLNSLGGICVDRGDSYIITRTGRGSYYILCFNYKWYNFSYFLEDENVSTPEKVGGLFQDDDALEYDIVLKNVEAEDYVVKRRSVNAGEGSLLGEWGKFQYDSDLDSQDVKYIRQACYPRISMERKTADGGRLKFHVQLMPHEIALFHIYRKR